MSFPWARTLQVGGILASIIAGVILLSFQFASPLCFDLNYGDDSFCDVNDALDRASELGCVGVHEDGDEFRPCKDLDTYVGVLERES